MVGQWQVSPQLQPCSLPQDVATAFAEATGLVGATYEPLLYVGSQMVSGQNYMLICKQTLMTREQEVHVVKMVIYDPLAATDKAIITEIERLL